jgi:membrane-associated phospholipid phosphatase
MLHHLLFLALTSVGWYAAYRQRTSWIEPLCQKSPELCTPETVNWLDRSFLINYHAGADFWSFVTQDLAAVLAVGVALGVATKKKKGSLFGAELLVLLQATSLNGVFNECIRLWIQRPRPFVFLDPVTQGGSAAHYTSFYSGHTSFAALAAICALWSAKRAQFNRNSWMTIALLGTLLTLFTGALRVAAGRHFITDTVAGAFFGALIAWGINRLHQTRSPVR